MSDKSNQESEVKPAGKCCAGHQSGKCCRRGGRALLLLAVIGVAGFFAWKAWAGEGFDYSAAALRDPARAREQAERIADRTVGRFDMPLAHKEAARKTIIDTAEELQPLLSAHHAARASLFAALGAERIDPDQLEALRSAELARADEASRKLVGAMLQLGQQLTPTQRRELLARWQASHD